MSETLTKKAVRNIMGTEDPMGISVWCNAGRGYRWQLHCHLDCAWLVTYISWHFYSIILDFKINRT